MPLRATSCLADNSWPILDSIVDALRDAGHDTIVDRELDPVDADVLFGCGLLTRELIDAGAPLEVIAAPVFPEESVPVYRSLVVARESEGLDLPTATRLTFGVNEYGSWSGWFAYLHHLADNGLRLPDEDRRYQTGSHAGSVQAVLAGDCDLASIDSSVWHHHDYSTDGLTILATTRDWPAPPIAVKSSVNEVVRSIVASTPGLVPTSTAVYDVLLAEADRFR